VTRCFVTGANGFIGSQVVRRLLEHGHEVTALVGRDRDCANLDGLSVERRTLDLLDASGVRSALEGGEALVHTAACYSFWERDPDHIYRVNVEGTRNVLAAAAQLGYGRVVHTSSAATLAPAAYGAAGTEEPIFDLRRGFQGHYKSAKVMAEIAALRAAARGLHVSIVHPTTVVGEGDRRPTPTGGMVLHYVNGRMKAYADTVLNVVDVEDVAEGHVLALEQGAPGGQYLLGGENLRMPELLAVLEDLTGIPAPRFAIPRPVLAALGRAGEWIADHVTHRTPLIDVESTLHARVNRAFSSEKARKELGYQPRPARLALAKAICWFVAQGRCKPRYARRIEARGSLREVLAGRA
jgi:dihydroflavonol-4-reductase